MSTHHSTPADYRTPDDYPLRVGDRVTDIKQLVEDAEETGFDDEPETAIVIDTLEGDAHDVTFDSATGEISLAEYDPNTEYANFDVSTRVVRIAWEGWLDSNVPGWDARRGDPESLSTYLAEREQSWDVPVSTIGSYDYPESRLRLEDRP